MVLSYGILLDEMIRHATGQNRSSCKIVMCAEIIDTKLDKIVMHAEHEIRNFCLQNRAEHEIRDFCLQNHAEHEIRNFCSPNCAEQVSNSIMPSIINEILNLINL